MGQPRKSSVVVGGVAVAAVPTVILALMLGIPASETRPTSPPSENILVPTSRPPSASATPSPSDNSSLLPVTDSPDVYASAVAASVFAEDTLGHTAGNYRDLLHCEADPTMSDSGRADLFASIDAELPTEAMWNRMRANQQWSQWSTARTWEPADWAQVVTGGYAEAGWVMRNVTGTQTLHFLDSGTQRVTTRQPILSIAMRCPAPGATVTRCWLVLLSAQVVS